MCNSFNSSLVSIPQRSSQDHVINQNHAGIQGGMFCAPLGLKGSICMNTEHTQVPRAQLWSDLEHVVSQSCNSGCPQFESCLYLEWKWMCGSNKRFQSQHKHGEPGSIGDSCGNSERNPQDLSKSVTWQDRRCNCQATGK